MTPAEIVKASASEGLVIRLTPQGGISLVGNLEVVGRWSAVLKPQKLGLIAYMTKEKTYRHWLIHFIDRESKECVYCPEATYAEVMAEHPGAVAAEPCTNPTRQSDHEELPCSQPTGVNE